MLRNWYYRYKNYFNQEYTEIYLLRQQLLTFDEDIIFQGVDNEI